MEPHSSKQDPEPSSLKDSEEFRELAERMQRIAPNRRADAFEAAESTPPSFQLFTDDDNDKATPDDSQCPPDGN